jgi:hypothetical protein
MTVLRDLFGAECDQTVKALVPELRNLPKLVRRDDWVPEGATEVYQPLGQRMFNALKLKGRAKWR